MNPLVEEMQNVQNKGQEFGRWRVERRKINEKIYKIVRPMNEKHEHNTYTQTQSRKRKQIKMTT